MFAMIRNRRILITLLTVGLAAAGLSTPSVANRVEEKVAQKVRIGFFANVTHAPALVGQDRLFFERTLKRMGTTVEWVAFNAGPTAIESLKAGAIDMTYIGPNPAINGFAVSKGSLLRIVAGSTSGGAELVTRPSLNSVEDLKGKKIATPQLGNTQDVALRAWLKEKGLRTSITGGGDVTVIPTENAQTLALFQRGDIDGAWLPEPWSTRLILEAGAKVFLDERNLWPKGQFVTTHIIAHTDFLKDYPVTVRAVITAHLRSIDFISRNASQSQDSVQRQIERYTGKRLPDPVMSRAWSNLRFTVDPIANSLRKSASDAVDVGLLTTLGSGGLAGIYDLRILNQIRRDRGLRPVSNDGLGL